MQPKRLVVGGILLVLTLGIALPAAKLAYFATTPLQQESADTFIIEIQRGQRPSDITKALADGHVINDTTSFMWVGRLGRLWKKIKSGEYQVSPGQSPIEIFSIITSGISIAHPVTVREGENMYEVAWDIGGKKLAAREKFIELCKDPKFIATLGFKHPLPKTLEGYLYPDTYHFNRAMSAEDMIRQMVRHFNTVWGEKEDARARELSMSRHELITLASIVEKETGAPEERPLIASVFFNRLKKRMRLQSDPTTIYGMWERYAGKLRRSDLLEQNEYNTYAVSALPAGPIANPGREAIQAVLFPAQSEFLYFVSHNDGTHQFSRSLEEHNAAVRKFQLDPKAREGKSWRDLKARKVSN